MISDIAFKRMALVAVWEIIHKRTRAESGDTNYVALSGLAKEERQ